MFPCQCGHDGIYNCPIGRHNQTYMLVDILESDSEYKVLELHPFTAFFTWPVLRESSGPVICGDLGCGCFVMPADDYRILSPSNE
jgi:hypothetical protein